MKNLWKRQRYRKNPENRISRSTAIFFLGLLSILLSSSLLHAQEKERAKNLSPTRQSVGRSWIVRMAPGGEVKNISEQIAARIASFGSMPALRSVVPLTAANRTPLSDHRLDRYLVLDFGGSDSLREEDEGVFRSVLQNLQNLKGVEEVFPNHTYHIDAAPPNDSLYGEQWALRKIGGPEAWEVAEGLPDVLVGVLDTGIEWDHPDLKKEVWINGPEDLNKNGLFDPWPFDDVRNGVSGDLDGIDQDGNGYPDDVIGYDFVDQDVPNIGDWSGRDGVPEDDHGHGTNVSGVIAATKDNGIGVAGIASGVRVVTLRSFDGTGNGQDDDIAAAIVYAADRGVRVLNMSFGDFYRSPLMYDAVRYAYDKGVLLIASSGNDGVPDPHYPSGFSEVVAVGATDSADRLSFFSAFGSQLSLVAPGVRIVTTDREGEYKAVDGTSFSSPYVAGVAALMRGLYPDWTADEITAVLEASTDDLGVAGWDENFGAGRLNAAAAVRSKGPALLEITAPLTDEGAAADSIVAIYGSAVAPLLQSWRLEVGKGGLPEEWTLLTESQEGIHKAQLGLLDTRLYPDTLLTLRLVLRLTNGRTLERRHRFFLDRTPPAYTGFAMRNIWRNERRAIAVTFHTDDLTRGIVWIRPSGDAIRPWIPVELEPERVGLTRTHYYFLTSLEMVPGAQYDLYVELINASGRRTFIGSRPSPLSARIEQASFPVSTMERQEWELPYSFVLNDKIPLPGGAGSGILLNRFDNFSFERLFLYRFDNDRFVSYDSAGNWIPRGVGDSDGDGLKEVLGQSSRTGIVYEQQKTDGSLFASVMFADTTSGRFYPGAFYDFDGDGRDELIGYTSRQDSSEQYYFVAAWDGTGYVEQGRMPNATLPERGFARNFMGASDVIVSDFNGNGKADLLFGDDDGDFMVYERESAGSFKLLWADENEGEEGDRMIAAGDLDNDGIDEAIVAYRSSSSKNDDREYAPPLWTLRVISMKQGGAQELAREEFAYVRPSNPFRPGLEVGNLDGKPGDEIALSAFPNMYVLRWDPVPGRLRPFWWRDNSIINRPIIQDFDGNGVNELGVGDGTTINFYEVDSDAATLLPPAGAQGWALNDSTTFIEWEPVPGAERYHIYRALLEGSGPISFLRIATVDQSSFVDTGYGLSAGRLDANRRYGYIVTAVDDSAGEFESTGSRLVEILTHNPLRIVRAEPVSAREIRVEMSGRVAEKLYRSGILQVVRDDGGGTPLPISSVLTVGEREVLLSLFDQEFGTTLTIRPTSLFRDFFDAPVDTMSSVQVEMPAADDSVVFIATKGEPAEGDAPVIAVEFSAPVDPVSGADPTRYEVDPPGEIMNVSVDPGDPRRVLVRLEESYPLGPYGYNYLVTIIGVRASDGRLITTGAGSVVGFTISADDLEGLFVYPHPFSLSKDGEVTFAGLTPRGMIRIYTHSGALLRELAANRGDGGMSWDGTDATGRKVPAGIYLYSVVMVAPNGDEQESRLRKIAIVP